MGFISGAGSGMNAAVQDAQAGAISAAASALSAATQAAAAGTKAMIATNQAGSSASSASTALGASIAAEAARDAAAASWAAALAANPDLNSAVKMNPSTLLSDLVIPSFYNASSVGPLTIGEGINITINDSANWSIL